MPDDTVRARLARLHELVKDPDEVTFLCCELDKTNAAIERLRGEIAERQQTDLGPEIEIILNKHALDLYETDPAPAESDAAPEDFQKAFDRVTQKIGPSCARLAESDAEWHAQAAAAAAEYDDMEREAEANGGADAMTRALIAAGRKSLAMGPPSPEITPAMIEAGAYEHALEHMEDEPVTVRLADRLIAENIIRAALEAK
jgi:hypothetical protein